MLNANRRRVTSRGTTSKACRMISCMAALPEPSLVLSFEEARRLVDEHAARLQPRGKELLELLESAGRVLAEPVPADRNFPPFHRAMRDGYAVRAADLAPLPATLDVIGEIKAGAGQDGLPTLQPGQAVAIMTGAPAPPAADAVVMVEHTSPVGSRVQIMKAVAAGENIATAGSEAKRGELLLSKGRRLDYAAIAIAASTGRSRLLVYRKPQVAILATGDEIVDIDLLDQCLGHTRRGVLGVYQRSARWPERVRALNAWSDLILGVVEDSNIVPIRARS